MMMQDNCVWLLMFNYMCLIVPRFTPGDRCEGSTPITI